jgi:DNA polymerase-3 subunit epsilon
MRQIVLDTETTGIDPQDGHRLVEIGCLELENYVPTGRILHLYLNPEREVPAEAEAVHGLSTKFLKDKPLFAEVYTELLDFIDGAPMVIHNAEFDIKFLNHELKTVGHPGFKLKDAVDTLKIAREKFPGSPANLDALCRRFGVDNSGREYHGALLDSQLLAEVYLELLGEQDDKLIAVPSSSVDPYYDRVAGIDDLPEIERQRIEAFFRVYKQLPAGRKPVELGGFRGAEVAGAMVAAAVKAYRDASAE